MRKLGPLFVGIIGSFTLGACDQAQYDTHVLKQEADRTFDPRFTLDWPGKPNVTFDEPTRLATKGYRASLDQRNAKGGFECTVSVLELTDESVKGQKPLEFVEAYLLGSKRYETKRTVLAFGAKNFPGLDIERVHQLDGKRSFDRVRVVMAGNRIYSIGVSGNDLDSVNGLKAQAFLDSFRILDN